MTGQYNTPLTPAEEAAYQAWGQREQTGKIMAGLPARNPAADTYDYDMRGFWKSGGKFAGNGHAGDQFKKPNHPTFSTLSQYNGQDGNQGGTWGGGQNGQPWTFTPSATNLQHNPAPELQKYFQQVEPGNQLILPPVVPPPVVPPPAAPPSPSPSPSPLAAVLATGPAQPQPTVPQPTVPLQ